MSKSIPSYKVYENKFVKRQLTFFEKKVYPVNVLIRQQKKTFSFKSAIFEHLLTEKYQRSFKVEGIFPDVEMVIKYENELIEYVIRKLGQNFSFELFKREYDYYSKDITSTIDNHCKMFLIDFFKEKEMPILEQLVEATAGRLMSHIIIKQLNESLHPAIKEELLNRLPGSCSLLDFYRRLPSTEVPILTKYGLLERKLVTQQVES